MNQWIAHESHTDREINLFCFPHAGGTAAFYASWGKIFEGQAILPVQFPMREKRIREKMMDSIQELAQAFADACIDLIKEKDFAFFGHCSGSIVAYETALYLKKHYGIQPLALFVSSCYAPRDYRAPSFSQLGQEELLAVISKSGFIAPELLAEPVLFEYFAPIVRKDFSLQEAYVCPQVERLPSPIVALYGKEDETLQEREKIEDWMHYTEEEFQMREFPGSHFYLEQETQQVAQMIDHILQRRLDIHGKKNLSD